MTLRTTASVILIIFAIGLTFFLFVRPVLQPNIPETISEVDLTPAGKDDDGADLYYHFKEEAKDWMKILAPIIPFIVAYILKGKKKEKK